MRAGHGGTDRLNGFTEQIIGAAITVHHELGPGFLESSYQPCLVYELLQRGLPYERQKPMPLVYRDVHLDCGYRVDLLVENAVVVEVKSITRLEPVYQRSCVPICDCRDVK